MDKVRIGSAASDFDDAPQDVDGIVVVSPFLAGLAGERVTRICIAHFGEWDEVNRLAGRSDGGGADATGMRQEIAHGDQAFRRRQALRGLDLDTFE